MMSEVKSKENSEIKAPENNRYKEILPENGTKYSEAKNYWSDVFSENGMDEIGERTYYDDNGESYRKGNELEPNKQFEKNGYTYTTDDLGRVVSAEGQLQVKDHKGRNEMPDTRDVVAHGTMQDSDDRGHLIADRFNGSGELENLVPMEGKLNKGDYAKLEDTLASAVNDGADVRLRVEPIYTDDSVRPDEFRVSYTIDGDKEVVVFKNGSVEK